MTGNENGTTFDVNGDLNMYICRFTNQSEMNNNTFEKYAFTINLQKNSSEDIFENRSIFNVEAIGVDLKDKTKLFPGMCNSGFAQVSFFQYYLFLLYFIYYLIQLIFWVHHKIFYVKT